VSLKMLLVCVLFVFKITLVCVFCEVDTESLNITSIKFVSQVVKSQVRESRRDVLMVIEFIIFLTVTNKFYSIFCALFHYSKGL
jgi:hypothetical protein